MCLRLLTNVNNHLNELIYYCTKLLMDGYLSIEIVSAVRSKSMRIMSSVPKRLILELPTIINDVFELRKIKLHSKF